MCLLTRKTKKEMDKWLRTQPDIITAYKIVGRIEESDEKYKLIPIFSHCRRITKEYEKINRIKGERHMVHPIGTYRRPYRVYFHLWLEKPPRPSKLSCPYAPNYSHKWKNILVKCYVPKHLIVAIGTQLVGRKNSKEKSVVVTKGFEFVSNYHFC